MANGKEKIYQMITDIMIEALKEGIIPWEKPWLSGGSEKNLVSMKSYRGTNTLMTHIHKLRYGFKSNYWLTYKQANEKGGQVKKGAKSCPILYWNWVVKKNEDGQDEKFPILRYYRVFNLDEIEGIETPAEPKPRQFNSIKKAEALIKKYKGRPSVDHGGDRAYYSPQLDQIRVPEQSQFKSDEEYYGTLFHEYLHSTGHKSRLNRDMSGWFGCESYATEELVAEIGASMLCGIAGIEKTIINNSKAYIQSWIKKLQQCPETIIQASQRAQKACDYMQGIKAEYED